MMILLQALTRDIKALAKRIARLERQEFPGYVTQLDVNSDILRLRTAKTPASAGAAGNAGDICWDSSYLYICIANATWRRVAHSTW